MADSDFVATDKPAGLTTHTSLNDVDKKKSWVDARDGFMEWLESRLPQANDQKLFPVHRLDRETTGVLLFALTPQAAERARTIFESREAKKEYLFLTDRQTSGETAAAQSLTAASFIERVGNEYVSRKNAEPNSQTTFEKIRGQGRFTLWRARPLTGKPHQIRLHAEDCGLSLLGDVIHGGSEYPTLCLHSASLELPAFDDHAPRKFESPAPIYFDDLSLLADRKLVRWLAAIDRRERAIKSTSSLNAALASNQTVRWIHREGDPLRVEQLGEVINLNWFSDQLPSESDWRSIDALIKIRGWTSWYLQLRSDRGKDPHTDRALASEPPPPERWTASEKNLAFEFRRETGLSPGLFLDQRENRSWLRRQVAAVPHSRVLNLFCYTGGFSVAAAAGGAGQVVSVDVSKPFLDWAKRNFELNALATEPHEFRSMDAGEYLAWAQKKELKFDFIICDPPSFARTNTRGKKSVFRIETEFDDLLKGCFRVSRKGTRILFSTNYEQWTLDQFAERAQNLIRGLKLQAHVCAAPSPDLDFELPRSPRHMKSLLIEM